MNKIISIILALTLVISGSPMNLSSANTASSDIVIDNSNISNDNEYVVNATGTKDAPIPLVKGTNTGTAPTTGTDKYCYFTYKAIKAGTISVYCEGEAWRAYTWVNGDVIKHNGSDMCNPRYLDTPSTITQELAAGDEFVIKITPYISYKYGGEITFTFDPGTTAGEGGGNEGGDDHQHTPSTEWTTDGTYHWHTCGGCAELLDKGEHTFGAWNSGKRTCSTCQYEQTCDHPKNKQKTNEEITTPATCGAAGSKTVTVTCECGTTISTTTQEIPATGDHKYGEDGKCTCGATDPDYCEHNWIDANCYTPKTCSKCGNTDGNALGHDMGEFEVYIPATCTTTGAEIATCKRGCDHRVVEVIKPLGHDFKEGVCQRENCGEKDPNYVPECEHTYTDCDDAICNKCNEETRTAPGHSYGDWVNGNKTCGNCGHVVACQHRGGYATCIRLATCSDCGMSYGTYGDHYATTRKGKAPTCTEPGLTDGSYCSRYGCGTVLVEQEEIPATGEHIYENGKCTMCGGDQTVLECEHQWSDATCTAPKTCPKCGSTEGKALGHSYTNYVSNNDATCSKDGTETAICDNACGSSDTRTDEGSATGEHNYVEGKCSCGAEDPNYAPEGTEGNPKLLTEEEHTITLERTWGPTSYYYYYFIADLEGAATIKASGYNWKMIITRYDLEGNELGQEDYRPENGTANTTYILALEADVKIVVKFVVMAAPPLTITTSLQFTDCHHVYDANCEDGNCNNCNGTRIALDHDWSKKDGICVTCKFECQHGEYDDGFCTTCGKECDHNWTDATCTSPKTCTKCQKTKGDALGHDWSNKDGVCVTCKAECQHGELTAVCPICGKAPEIKYVAKIGNTKYETLQDAIDAAKSGETIVLLSDLELTHADAHVFEHETANQYKVMFAVAGKDITIDLNGKTISVTATPASLDDPTTGFGRGTIIASKVEGEGMIDWKADQVKGMLMAVIAVYDKGHLTLKDTAGTGGIQTTAYSGSGTSCGIVYSVLTNYSTDSSITIEAGKYEADFTKDSLVYTYASANEGIGNVGVVVKGGTFILGNAGEGRNGSTWIFNAKGQNERHVWITGGSFNTDIRHQYWIFEAQVSGDCALVKNGEMYTIVSAKYTVNEQYKSGKWYTYEMGYTTLAEAVAAAEANAENAAAAQKMLTITMLDNDTGAGAEVNGFNLIIDFNGRTYTLTSGGFQVTEDNTLTLKNGTLQVAEGAKIGQGVDASEAKVQYMP